MFKRLAFMVLSLVLLLCFASASATAQSRTRELKYTLEPILDKAGLRFRIDLRYRGDATETTRLVLPNRWGGQSRLYQTVRNLRIISPKGRLSDTDEPHVKLVNHQPNQMLQIQYELVQDFAGNPRGSGGRDYYRPILQPEYFHWIGHGAWVYPQWDEHETILVTLEWKNFPRSWTLANSFAVKTKNQRFQATLEEFIHAVFAGGDFRIQSIPVRGKAVYTAVRGSWQFSDPTFAEMVQRIVTVERDFWRDQRAAYYLVTLLPLESSPGSINIGGTGLTNSFANFASTNSEIDRFKHLLAHEYFHNWNSVKLGRLQEPDKLLYWFSEGFTDYYTYLLLLRSGLISLDEYIQRYNSWIREYYLSPVRTANNQRVLQDFWNDDDVHDLPYRRGFLLATNLNALIRSYTAGRNSLDDAMRDMFRAAQGRDRLLTTELIGEHIGGYAGRDVLPDIRRYIDNGETIMPEKNAFGPHIEVEMVGLPLFELGFDLERLLKEKTIAGVVESSAAYRAGLRNGQSVVKRSPISVGDATKPVELTIRTAQGDRTIQYYPATQKTVRVPQFKFRPGFGDRERAETLKWLGVPATKS